MSGPADLLTVARGELGTAENPPYSNRVRYSAWYGLVGAWCDMFVSWCADQSGNGDVIGRFSYTPSHEAWFRSKGREVPIRGAQPGDIVFFNFIGRTSHVGIVEANRGDGLVTIEGNTNGSGSRDGGSVMRHFRSWSSGIVSVHRPAYTASSTTSGGFGTMTDEEILAEFVRADERAKAREAAMVDQIVEQVTARLMGSPGKPAGLLAAIRRTKAKVVEVAEAVGADLTDGGV